MYFVSVFVVAVLMFVATLLRDRSWAACIGWGAALILPVWLSKKLGAIVIDVRVTVAVLLALLIMGFVDHRRVKWHRWLLTDVIVLLLVATQCWSMSMAGDLKVSVAIQMICHWVVPYVFGRLLIASVGDIVQLTRTAVIAITVLSIVGFVECVTGRNLINTIFFGTVHWLKGDRWGLTRSIGSMDHPIYFGILLLLLLPWGLHAAKLARQGAGPVWWRFVPLLAGVGVFSTLSRGPLLGVFILVAATLYVHHTAWRLTMTTAAIVVTILAAVNMSASMDVLHKSSGEERLDVIESAGVRFVGEPATVVIDRRQYEYNGTSHRYLQFLVFSRAVRDAGWFGFGKWGLHPEHITYLEPEWRNFFWSIDNHYILMTLEAGKLGIFLFIALGLTTCLYALQMSLRIDLDQREIATGLLVGLATSMLLLLTVWFAPSFGFFWLMNVGMLCQWWAEANTATAVVPGTPNASRRTMNELLPA